MRRLTCTLVFLLFLVCTAAVAQNLRVVRIGVSPLSTQPKTVSSTEARDRLVKLLNQQRRPKQWLVASIPLSNEWGTKALEEAREKNCDFVLSTRLADLHTSTALVNNGPAGLEYVPAYNATIEYRLIRTSDGAGLTIGSAKQEDSPALDTAVWLALHLVARQSIAEIENHRSLLNGSPNAQESRNRTASKTSETPVFGPESCAWLPSDFPHADAVRKVCEFAMTLPQKMPNFICDQEASRYRGKNKVPFDIITASIRYEDGSESYKDVKMNGKPVPEAISQSPGLWSTGQFGSNLRSIFDANNQVVVQFVRDGSINNRPIWIFAYHIAKQNDPLWRLHSNDEVLAPPYRGELWVDQQTGQLLHFNSAAVGIPPAFGMEAASLEIDYAEVNFSDGSSFPLPATFIVATRYRDQEPTRNVVRFNSCHKFRAKAQMVLNVPDRLSEMSAAAVESDASVRKREIAENDTLYSVLREQAVRDDAALLADEQKQQLNAATIAVLTRVAHLQNQLRKTTERLAASAKTAPAPPVPNIETTLRVSVKLVPVMVVLRDSNGKAVGSLHKEDFHLFDNGSPQVIKSFSVERTTAAGVEKSESARPGAPVVPENNASPPDRYVAYLFDDVHTAFEDLASAREAASHRLNALRAQDRVAIFTTSGQVALDFTFDRDKLQQSLLALRPHPLMRGATCPPISHYIADLIVNRDDREALGLATMDTINCAFAGMRDMKERAEQVAKSTAIEVLNASSSANQATLSILREVFAHVAVMPGARSVVLVSPGFLTLSPETRQGTMELIDRALQSEIIVNTLDVRGLTAPIPAANQSHSSDAVVRFRYDREEDASKVEVLADLAYSTGGTFFHNNNDLNEGFRRTAETPEYVYVLGFSPQKLDGKVHKLKVRLNTPTKLSIQARAGYYALKPTPIP